MTGEINKKMARGAAWMIAAKFAERGIGLISTLVLARLLTPADFGLVAMATAIVAILDLMGAFSFDVALIQHPNPPRSHYDTAWTFNFCFGLFSGAVLVALAIPAAAFYAEPRLEGVMYVLAVGAVVYGLANVGLVQFRKELDFAKEFHYQLRRKLIAFTVTLILAFTFRNYWALVLGSLAGNMAGVVLSYVMSKYRPRLSFGALRELGRFSGWMFINNLLNFMTNRFADLVIGRMLGTKALGVYSVSYEFANLPTNELVAPINRAVFPGYAKLAGKLEDLARGYLQVAALVAFFALPAGLGICAIAPLMVQVVLGPQWIEATPILALLAARGAFTALSTNVYSVCLATGKPRLVTGMSLLFLAVLIPSLIAGVHWFGLLGAVYAYCLATIVQVPYAYGLAMHLLPLRLRQILQVLWRPLLASALMFVAVRWVVIESYDPSAGAAQQLPYLLGAIGLGAFLYIGSAYLLWRLAGRPEGAEQHVMLTLRNRLAARRKAAPVDGAH